VKKSPRKNLAEFEPPLFFRRAGERRNFDLPELLRFLVEDFFFVLVPACDFEPFFEEDFFFLPEEELDFALDFDFRVI